MRRHKTPSSYPAEWFQKANEDFQRVGLRLKENDIEDAAFHLQQALEKYLKGFLLSHGWELKRIHDLEALLDDAVKYKRDLESFRSLLQEVTGYYLVERYPGFEETPEKLEVKAAFQQAKRLIKLLHRQRPSR